MLMKKQEDAEEDEEKEEYSEVMRQNLNNEVEKQGARILQMKIKAPQTKEGIKFSNFFDNRSSFAISMSITIDILLVSIHKSYVSLCKIMTEIL